MDVESPQFWCGTCQRTEPTISVNNLMFHTPSNKKKSADVQRLEVYRQELQNDPFNPEKRKKYNDQLALCQRNGSLTISRN